MKKVGGNAPYPIMVLTWCPAWGSSSTGPSDLGHHNNYTRDLPQLQRLSLWWPDISQIITKYLMSWTLSVASLWHDLSICSNITTLSPLSLIENYAVLCCVSQLLTNWFHFGCQTRTRDPDFSSNGKQRFQSIWCVVVRVLSVFITQFHPLNIEQKTSNTNPFIWNSSASDT